MTKGKTYRCDLRNCNKTFTTKFSLKRHNKLHISEKKFKCSQCTKAFTLEQYLIEHEHTHTGARPYICDYPDCNADFRQRGKLSEHKRGHYNNMDNLQ